VVFTDTHCHLNFNTFIVDLKHVINRAQEQGVEKIVVPGTDLETSRKAVVVCDRYDNIYSAVGVHPNDANRWDDHSKNEISELAQHPRVRALGEIGLDYFRNRASMDLQKKIFKAQLDLAAELNLPVIIHCRDAMQVTMQIVFEWHDSLQKHNHPLAENPGVFHAFDGDLETARRVSERGFFIGICGPVTFQNASIRQDVVAELPLENVVLETDAPFLTPHPHRGERNEPAFVVHIAHKVASLKKVDVTKVAEITNQNADKLFRWRVSN
jgi:TatD DNase family protein